MAAESLKLIVLGFFTWWLLLVLAILVAYLFARARLRSSTEEVRQRALDREFPASAFDVLAIAPRIRRVRDDYIAAAHCRAYHSFHRAQLLAVARRQITSLPYFRHERHEYETADATSVS